MPYQQTLPLDEPPLSNDALLAAFNACPWSVRAAGFEHALSVEPLRRALAAMAKAMAKEKQKKRRTKRVPAVSRS